MTGPKIIFWILAASVVGFSVMAIVDRRILRAAIYLLFVLVAMAGLYYMMNNEFLAAVQLILYAGGIVVLIIFSILLTSQINSRLEPPRWNRIVPAVATAVVGLTLGIYLLLNHTFVPAGSPAVAVTMRETGRALLGTGDGGYALPFEVISILLLAALVGTIFIAKRSDA